MKDTVPKSIPIKRLNALANLEMLAEIDSEGDGTLWSKRQFKQTLSDSRYYALGCEIGGELAAFAIFSTASSEGEIHKIVVRRRHRRQGLGETLLRDIIRRAKDLLCDSIFLEVRRGNNPAINLYRKFGFKIEGVRRRYYRNSGEDALVMKLKI